MKRVHKITIIAILICLIASSVIFASCDLDLFNSHKHDYGNFWFSDATHHWKQCSICSKKIDKQEHSVPQDGWVVITESSETQTGLRRGKCSVCKNTVEEIIDKTEHVHDFTGDYVADNLAHWKVCSCGQQGEFAEHVVVNWIVDSEATETTQGQQHGVCDVCKETITKTIPVVGHTHVYANTLSYDDNYHYYECDCGDKTEIAAHSYSEQWQSDSEKHWKACECGKTDAEQAHVTKWIIDKPATTTSTGIKHEECTVCGKTFGSQIIDKITSDVRTVDFYAINDFHGEVNRISSVGGYLKERKNENANTVLINSGDMFQGSMESNSNYGKLLTDCMDVIGFDAFTFGNHEFDWGLNKLETLASNSNVPFLGANIYHWNASSKTWGTFASELAQEYVVKTLDNGLKVGIIGVIGKDQITSISSNLVQTIGFKDPLPIIKELATELRSEQQCDVVVVSAHASPRGLVGESEGKNDPEAPTGAYGLEQYVDAVFCAHTHRCQLFNVDGIPFVQGGGYGSHVTHVTLSVNANGKVSYTKNENISYSYSWPNVLTIDSLVDNSNAQIADERNQVLTTLDAPLNSNPAMARLVSRAIAEYSKNQGYDIALAMVNTARQELKSGEVTYSELYESIPFDNVVYIAKVKGSDIINEVNYGNYYWRSSGEAIESNKYYTIAVIDYLLFHQNSNRDYNYFRSAFSSGFTPVPLTNAKYEVYNYRLITRDYLLANDIDANDYLYDNSNTDTSLLQEAVSLKYETTGNWISGGGSTPTPDPDPNPSVKHEGTIDDPFDVADALLLAKQSESSTDSPSGYVVGKVTTGYYEPRRGSTSDDLGRIYIEDDNGNVIYVYWLKMFENAAQGNNWDWTDVADTGYLPNNLKEGDTIVLYANSIYTYNSTIPQIYTGYCISINGEPTN